MDTSNEVSLSVIQSMVEEIVRLVVEDPTQVRVVSIRQNNSVVTLEIEVAPSDRGRVVGQKGLVINSLRTIARIVGAQRGLRVKIDLVE